jgi:hypothetical protein
MTFFPVSDDVSTMPVPLPEPERLVWHYTKHTVLDSILKNHELWAGNVGSLNDRDELRIGIRRVRQAFKKMKKNWDYYDDTATDIDFDEIEEALESAASDAFSGSAFVACFTPEGDDTPQWQKYAGPDGFAIAIPEGAYLPVVGSEPAGPYPFRSYIEEFPFRWISLLYTKSEQLSAAMTGLDRFISGIEEGAYVDARHEESDNFGAIFRDRASSNYVDAVASIKNKNFKSEREVRYTVTRPTNASAIHASGPNSTHVRITGATRNPFDTQWDRYEPEYYQATASQLPIRAIRVGPGNNFKATRSTLRMMLDANGYPNVEIKRSRSPLQ